jgi:sugar-specific transcriptional regulator TrmB
MLKSLQNLGFKQTDAEVYLFLATMGPQKAKNIAVALHMHKQQIYRTLKNLESRGIVNLSHEFPAFFSAVGIEEIVDSMTNAKKDQALTLQETKEVLLSNWRAITKKDNNSSYPSFSDS